MLPSPLRERLTRLASVVVSRGSGSLLQFGLNLVLGRTIGAAGLGVYYLFFSWTRLTNAATNLGFPPYVLREVSTYSDRGQDATARALLLRSLAWAAFAGTLVVVTALSVPDALLIRVAELEGGTSAATILRLAAASGAIYAMLRVAVEALKAVGRANLALNLEYSLVPAGLLCATGVVWLTPLALPTILVVWLHALLLATGLFIAVRVALYSLSPRKGNSSRTAKRASPRIERRDAIAFWLLGFNNIAFSTLPIVLMPRFVETATEVGQFGLALRLVGLAATILAALSSIFSPRFARLHTRADGRALRSALLTSQLYSVLLFLPLFLVFIGFGGPVLSIFGSDFVAGAGYLTIMATGQLVNSATGLSGQFLNMTGRQRTALAVSAASTLLMAGGIGVLGTFMGGLGVAIAAAGSVAIRNVAFLVLGFAGLVSYTRQPPS